MTESQRIQVRQSELRQKINAVNTDTMTDEERLELDGWTTQYQKLEVEYRRAVILEDAELERAGRPPEEQDSQQQEARDIANRARCHQYIRAAVERRQVSGAEAELNAVLNIQPSGHVELPLAMLLPRTEYSVDRNETVEYRADTVTALNALDGSVMTGRIIDRLFRASILDWLGIGRDIATSGSLLHVVMTGGTTADTVAPDGTHDAGAASFGTQVLEPHRLTARYVMRREDMTRLPYLEMQLQRDIGMVMMAQQEDEVFNGNSELTLGANGLVGGLDAGQTITHANIDTADYSAVFGEMLKAIEGLYATMASEIRILMTVESFRRLYTLDNANINQTLAEHLMKLGLMTQSSLYVGDTNTATKAWGFGCLQRGKEGAATVCTWPSVSLINDPYTKAAEGQVVLTAIGMHDACINRKENFRVWKTTAVS